ncbi:hypothetical protein [Sphingobacterium sp. WOUb80]|uniref:hypothetical protein n=1 Tax=Sphingobacterium sp. WOUb80 TaxID=3234028 RepID=UPI003CF51F19
MQMKKMTKSTYRKVIWKLIVIGFLILTISCGRDSFRRVSASDLNSYENNNNIMWGNSDSSLVLTALFDNGPFLQDYTTLLVLKYYNGVDSVYYLLKDTHNGNYIVRENKLYIFDREVGTPGSLVGWYESTKGHITIIDSVFVTGDSILPNCPNLKYFDKIAKTKPYGIYKIDGHALKCIAMSKEEQKTALEKSMLPGFYYYSSPGLGVDRIYDLSEIEERLKKRIPSTFGPKP